MTGQIEHDVEPLVLVTDFRLTSNHESLVPPLDDSAFDRYRLPERPLVLVARTSSLAPTAGPHLPLDIGIQPTADFRGFFSLARALPALLRAGWHVPREAPVLLRLPSVAGFVFATTRRLRRLPYAVEVAGDIAGVLQSGAVGPLLRFVAPLGAGAQRWAVRGATAVVYVTPRALQTIYPPHPSAKTAAVSDVQLEEIDFSVGRPARADHSCRLIAVGSQDRSYKGHHVLLEALGHLRALGVPATLDLVGDGRLNPALRAQTDELGLADAVRYHGQVTSRPVLRGLLDEADVFVMPSLTEGFPRALLEAMARGLPAVVSGVGGMPDIVDPDLCVPPGDAPALSGVLYGLLTDPDRLQSSGSTNQARARSFMRQPQQQRMLAWFASWAST